MPHGVVRQLARRVVPDAVLRRHYERYFFESRRNFILHLGKFESLEEARALLLAQGCEGRYAMDQRKWFEERTRTYFAHDYPVLFWLGKLIRPGDRLVDLGGSTGVTYRLFRSRLDLPDDFEWQVSDLPEVVQFARQLDSVDPVPHLSFTDDWRAVDGASIVLSAGALQFFPQRLVGMLDATQHYPEHILINRLPLVEDGPGFITLQNTGVSISPMRVESRAEFLADMASRRYELVDEWKCLENDLDLPFHHECDLRYFRGCYLRRCAESVVGAVYEPAVSGLRAPGHPVDIEERRPEVSHVAPRQRRRAKDVQALRPHRHPVLHPVSRRGRAGGAMRHARIRATAGVAQWQS